MSVRSYDLPDGYYQGVFLTLPVENKVSPWHFYSYLPRYAAGAYGDGFWVPDDGFDYYLTYASAWANELVYCRVMLYTYTSDYRTIDIDRSYYCYRGHSFDIPQRSVPVGHTDDVFQLIYWPVSSGTYHMHFCQSGYRVPAGD